MEAYNSLDLVDEIARVDSNRRNDPLSPTRMILFTDRMSDSLSEENININNPDFEENREENYSIIRKKILLRTTFCLIRVFFLCLFIYVDNTFEVNDKLEFLVEVLIAHEGLVIINFIQMTVIEILGRYLATNEINTRSIKIVEYTDVIANVIFFCWFIYGNYTFIYNKDMVVESLASKFILILSKQTDFLLIM